MKSTQIKTTGTLNTFLLATLVLFAANAQAQNNSVAAPCVTKITSHKDGDKVGDSATVRGEADVPVEGYLWLVARKSSMGNQWWPQGGGPVKPNETTRKWEAEVFFGEPRDVESNFDVVAVVVSQQTNKDLAKWFSTAQQNNRYPPVRFPDSISGCPIVHVRVTKQ
jgi:hypothetical protein